MDEAELRERLATNPDDWVVAESLTRLLTDARRWEELIELLFIRLERPEADRVDLFAQLAEVFENGLDDAERALLVLLEAFALNRDDERFGARLGRLAARAGQWDTLLGAYERGVTAATAREATPLHRRLAQWYEALEREEDQTRHLRRLLVLKPDDEDALEALTAFYETAQDWEGLTQLLRTRVNYIREADARRRLYLRVGRLLETRLAAPGEALEWLGRLFHESPDDGLEATLERLAEESGDWANLARIYQESIEQSPEDEVRVGKLHLRLGRIYRDALDDEDSAERHLREARRSGAGRQTFAELRRLYEGSEQWLELARLLGTEAARTDDRTTKYNLFLEQGALFQEKLDAPKEAVDAWFNALEARPDDKIVLVRLMDAYRGTGQWEASLKVLKKLASIEDELPKKANFVYAMGIIQRDKLADHYIAVRTLDRALELDPTMIKAFAAIDEILTQDGDYARQDRYYRKMLARAREHGLDESLIVNLARNLGEINRSRLGNYEEALKAYSIVVKRRPDDREARGIVAELSIMVQRYDDAARHLFTLIQHDVVQPEPYHDLVRVYCAIERYDAAWCVCQALVALDRSNTDEDTLYQEGLARQQNLHVGTMEALDWRILTWANKNRAIDGLLARLALLLEPRLAKTPKELGLRRALDANHPVARILTHHVAPVMGLPIPPMYASADPLGMTIVNTSPPALVVGSDVAGWPAEEIAFHSARHLLLLTGDHFLATLETEVAHRQARLVKIIATVHHWLDPRVPADRIDETVLDLLKGIGPGERETYGQLMQPIAGLPAYGVAEWLDAVEHTANRLGLLVSNALDVALRQSRRVQRPLGTANPAERTRALLLFALSEPYFELRRRLGYSIDG